MRSVIDSDSVLGTDTLRPVHEVRSHISMNEAKTRMEGLQSRKLVWFGLEPHICSRLKITYSSRLIIAILYPVILVSCYSWIINEQKNKHVSFLESLFMQLMSSQILSFELLVYLITDSSFLFSQVVSKIPKINLSKYFKSCIWYKIDLEK